MLINFPNNDNYGKNLDAGIRIRRFREAAGYTQGELGYLVGLSESAIRNFELGNRTPKPAYLEKIAMALHVDPAALGVSYSPDDMPKTMHILFKMQEVFGLHPEVAGGRMCLIPDKDGRPSEFTFAVMKWDEKERAYARGEITANELEAWKAKFPKSMYDEMPRYEHGVQVIDPYGDVRDHVREVEAEREKNGE